MPSVDLQKVGTGAPSAASNTSAAVGIGYDETNHAIVVNDGDTPLKRYGIAAKGGVQMTEVSIAAAAVATLNSVPVTLVAAPGAGYMLVFHQAVLLLDYTAPGFTESSDNLIINWGTSTPQAASETIEMTGFIDQTADSVTFGVANGGASPAIGAATKFDNLPLVLFNANDEFGGSGGSALRVKTFFSVVPTGF